MSHGLRAAMARRMAMAAAFLAGATAPSAVHGQDPASLGLSSLDSLLNLQVSAASLYEQSQKEAPANVTVVTRDEIEAYGFRTLADVLGSVSGFNRSSDLQYEYIGVRGFGRPADFNNRVLVLVDGHTVNESVLGAIPAGDAFPVDLRSIERVEVIRGPGSPLYGTRAMLAVVNVITQKGRDLDGVSATVGAGNHAAKDASLRFGGETDGGVEYSLFGSWYDDDGEDFYFPEFNSPSLNNGVADGNGWKRSARSNGTLTYKDLGVSFGLSRSERGMPSAPYGTTFGDPSGGTEDRQAFVDVSLTRDLSPDLRLDARVYHDRYDNSGLYPYPIGRAETAFGSRLWAGETHLRWDMSSAHRVVFGVEYQDVRSATWEQFFDGDVEIISIDDPYSIVSVFGQDEVQITRDLALTIAARHDRYSGSESTTHPRLALVHHLDESTTLKAMFGTAFRRANAYERWVLAPGFEPNPDLGSERVRSVEVSAERGLGPGVAVRLGAYQNRMSELIDQVLISAPNQPEVYQHQNLSEVKAVGAEAELNWSGIGGTRGHVRYALQRATDGLGDRISNFPMHSLRVGAFATASSLATVGVDGIFESGRRTIRGRSSDSFWLINVSVRSRPTFGGVRVRAAIRNALDTRYSLPAGLHHTQDSLVQTGRRFVVQLELGS